ncbi:Hypothetical predicted protein [Mytilus galloprovincialis]|uniref:B box-type domain-containing protein n=1 Tax=Mytilus galloprovincialis TaxID=29158 RepID=A0A8B6BX59_MYTGA|nr:Hypothetical predicted protein [Mytilus galloprovincialis]
MGNFFFRGSNEDLVHISGEDLVESTEEDRETNHSPLIENDAQARIHKPNNLYEEAQSVIDSKEDIRTFHNVPEYVQQIPRRNTADSEILLKNSLKVVCDHQRENCTVYCLSCKKYICHECIDAHKGHNVQDVKKLLHDLRQNIKNLQFNMKKHENNIYECFERLQNMSAQQNKYIDLTCGAISRRYMHFVSDLEDRSDKTLNEISNKWELYISKYRPVEDKIERLHFIHDHRHQFRKLLKENNRVKIIIAHNNLNKWYPVTDIKKSYTIPRIEYVFKLQLESEKLPKLWILHLNEKPINITKSIVCLNKLRYADIVKIHSMEISGSNILLSNSHEITIASHSGNSPRKVTCLKSSHATFLNSDTILACHENKILEVSIKEEHINIRTFLKFPSLYTQGCFVCNNGYIICLTPKQMFSDKAVLPIKNQVIKVDLSGEKLLDIPSDGSNIFTFPIRCYQNPLSRDIYILDRTGPALGELFILKECGKYFRRYDGKPILRKKNFWPTDLGFIEEFTIITDVFNYTLHILNTYGDAMYYINTQYIWNTRLVQPASITVDSKQNVYIGSWSKGNIAVLRSPQLARCLPVADNNVAC